MNYYECMQQALDYIERNLKQDIALRQVADEAGFSLYYFHRLFQGMSGYSLKEYIRIRRVNDAAYALVTSRARIVDIALQYGFGNQSSFTKAFKNYMGTTPGAYRKQKQHTGLLLPITADWLQQRKPEGGNMMEPKIVAIPEFRVMGMVYYGKNEQGEIPKMWGRFFQRINEIQSTDPNVTYGMCEQVEPAGSDEVQDFHYMACVKVDQDQPVPDGMAAWDIPTCTYAVFTHVGTAEKLGETYQQIYSKWLPELGYKLRIAYDFERYPAAYRPDDPAGKMEIYIPIADQ